MKLSFRKLLFCGKPILHVNILLIAIAFSCLFGSLAYSADPSTNLQGYGMKIFRVESGLYPFVQVYFRTFDQEMNPLVNLNELNIGLMVKGQAYAIEKKQYYLESIRNRQESIRTIFVLDNSKTMAGPPFDTSMIAVLRFIAGKRFQDQVAIIALDDNKDGYQIISNFESDPGTLGRRLADVRAIGQKTRLYDGIAAAMQLAAGSDAGANQSADSEYVASTSVIVFSDGKDEGSALSREDLMNRITNLKLPVPIYSLAYTKIDSKYLKNLQALSLNSFGKYFHIEEAYEKMTRSVEDIQNILQSDYVLTFRAYLPVDGEAHIMKVGLEYPSRSGKFRYESSQFEALAPPTEVVKIMEMQKKLDFLLKPRNDVNPYMESIYSPKTNAIAPNAAQSVENTQEKASVEKAAK